MKQSYFSPSKYKVIEQLQKRKYEQMQKLKFDQSNYQNYGVSSVMKSDFIDKTKIINNKNRHDFTPKSKVIQEQSKQKYDYTEYKNEISYCHYNDAVYMGDMNIDKKHGKGMLFHDDGSIVIANYANDIQTGYSIIFRQNSISSLLYNRNQDLLEIVYKVSKYIIKMPFIKSSFTVHGKGILIDYQCQKIYQLTFIEGQIINKRQYINTSHNYNVFKEDSIGLLIGEKHQNNFGLKFQKHQAIQVQKQNNVLRIGFVNKYGKWHGLGCKLFVRNIQVSGFKSLFIKTIEVGYYRREKQQLFGVKHFQNGNKYIGHFQNNKIHGLGLLLSTRNMKWRYGKFQQGELIQIQSSNDSNYRQQKFKLWSQKLKQMHQTFDNIWIDLNINLPSQLAIYTIFKESLSFKNDHQPYKQSSTSVNYKISNKQSQKKYFQDKLDLQIDQKDQKLKKQPLYTPINRITNYDKQKNKHSPQYQFLAQDPFQNIFINQRSARFKKDYNGQNIHKNYEKEKYIDKYTNSRIPTNYNNKYSSNYTTQPISEYIPNRSNNSFKKSNSPNKMAQFQLYNQYASLSKQQQKQLKIDYEERRKSKDSCNFVQNNYRIWQYERQE